MANLNLRYFYDHYCKGSPHLSVAPVNPAYGVYCMACDFTAQAFLILACTPLLGIRRLPAPLEQFSVIGFYYHQWRDDLEFMQSPFNRVRYAVSRVPDALRLMSNYNPLTRAYKKNKGCTCQCKCECDGSCSNIIL